MSLFVKICGVTSTTIAEACARAGADAIGLVLAESPRRLSLLHAAAIADEVRGRVKVVSVFRRPSPETVQRSLDVVRPDLVQADHDHLDGLFGELRLPVFREGSPLTDAHGMFLYEGSESGVGQRVDIEEAAAAAQHGQMILAGGLNPDNVGEAVSAIRPFGVDVSSGVESSPGNKEPELIYDFLEAARSTEEVAVS